MKQKICISNLNIFVGETHILHDINLSINDGSLHVLTGLNGSGKSSLAYALMGHPRYTVQSGEINFKDQLINAFSVDYRARLGMFLAVQAPPTIAGLTTYTLLKEAFRAKDCNTFSLSLYTELIESAADKVQISRSWLHRPLDSGFSGGQKKLLELLALIVLQPSFIILDEIDSGLDSSAITRVAQLICEYRIQNADASFLVMSHQESFLALLNSDVIHTMSDGYLDK